MNHAIANLFSGHLVTALSHTLVHSLWQGALLSLVTGLIMTLTRKSSSARRYNSLVAVMALFALVVAGTFIIEGNKGEAGVGVLAGHYTVNPGPVPAEVTVYSPASPISISETIGTYLNRYAATIVWLWFLIVCARCVQLLSGLRDMYYLRHKDIFSIGSYWEERVRQLCIQTGIKRRVGIIESGRTKTPIVTGHLKPLILIPISMFTSLSFEEAEAILLHELAHIRRADYVVNLLQNLMEIIFFFNPAVLWLSALIKAERENCCDDMVLARSSKVNYLKALVACEEYNQPSPPYAMALKGGNGGLKRRVARIISNKNLSLNGREKSLLAACLVATGICTAAFTNDVKLNHRVTTVQKTAGKMLALSNSNQNVSVSWHKKDVQQQMKPNPAEPGLNATRSTGAVQSNTTNLPGNDPKITRFNFKSDAEKTRNIIGDMMQDGIITSTNDLSFKIGADEFVVNYQKQPGDIYRKYRVKYVGDQSDGDRIWYHGFDKDKYKSATNNYKSSTTAKKDADQTRSIISDMMNDGIITSPEGLSFKIGTDEFVVNYQKQQEAVYQKYRARYVTIQYSGSSDWIWYYFFDTHKWDLIVAHKYNLRRI